MIFPNRWVADLDHALLQLEVTDPEWGVAGCYGMTSLGTAEGWVYSPGPGMLGRSFGQPVRVQTLDEVVLIQAFALEVTGMRRPNDMLPGKAPPAADAIAATEAGSSRPSKIDRQ